ncbi:Uncharacterised protein [Mycobacteroides abscessus subsp. abscessus]|nr:Uncharacterised protein [Mycobacteroides abscessus subsp. abscessus]
MAIAAAATGARHEIAGDSRKTSTGNNKAANPKHASSTVRALGPRVGSSARAPICVSSDPAAAPRSTLAAKRIGGLSPHSGADNATAKSASAMAMCRPTPIRALSRGAESTPSKNPVNCAATRAASV